MKNNLAKLWEDKFMKRNIVMSVLLAIFLFPSLGFIRPSKPLSTAPIHKSVVWGFDCKYWHDITSYGTFNTYSTAQDMSSIIKQHGYTVDIQKNPTKLDTIRSSFDGAEIFFYIGHGAPTALALSDENCKLVEFSKDTLSKVNTSNLRFVLLSACETGKDTNDPNSILRAFKDAGATKVIGFNKKMNEFAIKQWSKKFWKYALQDGMEVSDAARRATNEMAQNGVYTNVLGWNTDSLVILGTDSLYLGYKPSFPDFSQGWEL
ncbi:MAG: C25 family cysteine peptidase, partial [Methylococcales bacterium]|nr:C25 family cysteine peptidase [Methylococcales bacterium]